MSKVLLDTDILSEILKGKNAIVMKRAAEYLAVEGRYTTTVLSVMEVVRGFYRIGAVDRADQFVSFLSAVEVLPFDTESAILAGRIDAALTNRGRIIGVADVAITACALVQGHPVCTGNREHYEYIQAAGFPVVLQNWRSADHS
jgi:tRNA(fMet)-specific endonuclease VapC